MYQHILVPTDGSPLSDKAVRQAAALAKAIGAKMTILHVVEEYHAPIADEGYAVPAVPELRRRHDEAAREGAQKILDNAKKIAAEEAVACDSVVASGDAPYEAILREAQAGQCDLIVMASHGRRGFQALLLGSETAKVLTHSAIPVLVCR